MQIIRIPHDHAGFLADRFNGRANPLRFTATNETILDWAYPVHIHDTQAIAEHAGGDWREFRKKLGRAERAGLTSEPINLIRHGGDMLRLCGDWAKADRGGPDDRSSPIVHALALWRSGQFDLDGFVTMQDNEVVGFQIWENPLDGCDTANGLVGIGHTAIAGLSEHQEWEKARILADNGIQRVCVGGSESAGLDDFKRKLRPVQSLSLKTLRIDRT